RFEDRFVADERGLDLGRRDVDSRHLQHVVGAPAVYEIAVLVLAVLVAAARPAAVEGAAALVAVVPVVRRARGPGDLQLTYLARLDRRPLLVDQTQLVPREGFPGGAVAQVA